MIQHAAFERFGLVSGIKDYNLSRIVRVVGMATACRFAAFIAHEGGRTVFVAAHGAETDAFSEAIGGWTAGLEVTEPFFAGNLADDVQHRDHPAVAEAPGLRAVGAMPVYAATSAVIGALWVGSTSRTNLDTDVVRTLLNDSVRLIEDSLMMRKTSVRDPLTGLYNRRFFDDQINSEWRRAMRLQLPLSMLVIDIDHFKAYNDSLGHVAGDRAICAVADRISSRVRRAGDTVCRFGGEEFAMILPATDAGSGADLAESIRAAIEADGIDHPGHPEGPGRCVTVSVGVSTITHQADLLHYSANDMLAMADDALYAAKQAGRNRVRSKLPESYSNSEEAE